MFNFNDIYIYLNMNNKKFIIDKESFTQKNYLILENIIDKKTVVEIDQAADKMINKFNDIQRNRVFFL